MVEHTNKAYSILEATVVLVLVAIFVALSSNIFVAKVKSKTNAEIHGRFECYYKNGKLMQHAVIEGNDLGEQEVKSDHCNFIPNQFVRYIVINIVGGGAGPYIKGSNKKGGGAGAYRSLFFPSALYSYSLYPAKPSKLDGDDSKVTGKSSADSDEQEVVIAKGGINGKSLKKSTIEDVKSCVVSQVPSWDEYNCGTSAKCEIIGDNIVVSYCRNKNSYRTESDLKYNSDNAKKYKSIVHTYDQGLLEEKNGVWRYYSMVYYSDINCDPLEEDDKKQTPVCLNYKKYFNKEKFKKMQDRLSPCLYVLELKIDLAQQGEEGEKSSLSRYINAMGYQGGIVDISPGDGGSTSDTYGHAGGIVILY